jgi:hypothetical protein
MASASTNVARNPAIKGGGTVRSLPARPTRRVEVVGEIARYIGAVSILLVGVVHAQQYYDAYFSVVPTIGTLFLLSFVGSGVVGVVLIAPVRRLGQSIGDLILVVAALGAIGIAVGSLASLLVSEYTPLFGFMESGYRLAIVLALVFDSLTTVFLGAFVLLIVPRLIQTITTKRRSGQKVERSQSSGGGYSSGGGW